MNMRNIIKLICIILCGALLPFASIAAVKSSITSRVTSSQSAPITQRTSSAEKAPIMFSATPPSVLALLKTNTKQNIPIYLGTVTVTNSAGAPNFSLSRYQNMGLSSGPNILINTKKPVDNKPTPGLLNPADVVFADNDQIMIKSKLDYTKDTPEFFTVGVQYNSNKNSAGQYVGRTLTIVGTYPSSAGSNNLTCTIQVDINNLLSRFMFTNAVFFWIAVNISFDTSGNFLKLDSLDICWVQDVPTGMFQRLDTIVPGQLPQSIDLRVAKVMLDSDNYYQDCVSQ
jgi:hypothetical protein